jgi:acetyl esterase/lipase
MLLTVMRFPQLSLPLTAALTVAFTSTARAQSTHEHASTPECLIPTSAAADVTLFQSDIVFRIAGRDTLRLDLSRPSNSQSRGLVVIVHGGGWRAGNKSERLSPVVRRIAAAGYAVASVDYRLTTGDANRFPAALEDVWCAVAFLRRQSRALGINADRIVIAGESAGSQLAAMTALAPDIAGRACPDPGLSGSLTGVIGMYGIYDFLSLDDQPRALDAVTLNLGGLPTADTALARRASPIHHVSARTPPVLLVHGTADRSVALDQSMRMRNAVRASGIEADLVEVPGFDHGFPMVSSDEPVRASSCAILEFLRRRLGSAESERQPSTGFRVVARDFALSMPARTPSGLRNIRLVNSGTEPHYFGVVRVDSGKTLADFIAWRASRTARPGWLVTVSGSAPVEAGDSLDLGVRLTPGRYVAFCSYPSPDGTPHIAKGMVGEFAVESGARDDVLPAVDANVNFVNYAFAPPIIPRPGRRTWRVENPSNEMHQMLVIQLPDGVTPEQEIAWFRGGSRGPRPGKPSGGVLQLPPDGQVWLTMTFRPGRYLLLCTVTDPTGRPHDQLGMFSVIDVPER